MNKNYQLIIRGCVWLVIILLGLTAVFPEWLDLKDMIFADYELRFKEAKMIGSEQKTEDIFDFLETIMPDIHQIILSEMPDRPTAWHALLGVFQLIWQIASFILHVFFLVFFILVFSLSYTVLEKKINISVLSFTSKLGLGGGILVLSLALSLLVWPYITAIAVFMFKYLFLALEWLFSLG